MSYRVKEIFYTVQGEGYHAGTAAVFVRFTGCNMWTGRAEHRERDAARNGAECPKWCDTDFADGDPLDLGELLQACMDTLQLPNALPLVVLTGGEPLLQVDRALVEGLRFAFPFATIAVETNGSMEPKPGVQLDWICVSPKQAPERIQLVAGDEFKVVYPAYNPGDYIDIAMGFDHLFVSAEAETTEVGKSLIVKDNLSRAAQFCMENPMWRLTLQSHKIIGVP